MRCSSMPAEKAGSEILTTRVLTDSMRGVWEFLGRATQTSEGVWVVSSWNRRADSRHRTDCGLRTMASSTECSVDGARKVDR